MATAVHMKGVGGRDWLMEVAGGSLVLPSMCPCCGGVADPTATLKIGYVDGDTSVLLEVPHCTVCVRHATEFAARSLFKKAKPGQGMLPTCVGAGLTLVIDRAGMFGKGVKVYVVRDDYAEALAIANADKVATVTKGVKHAGFRLEGLVDLKAHWSMF